MALPSQVAFAAETNLALNKPVTASAEGTPAKRLTDGDKDKKTGRWSSELGPTQWAYVDLESSQEMNYFELTWESNAEYATDFNIYVSDSKDDWGEPDKAVKGNTSGVSKVKLDEPVTGRYVKLEVTKVSAYPNVSCCELEVMNISGDEPERPAEAVNLALKKPTQASVDYHNENGARAVDGKKDNIKTDRWMTETKPSVEKPMWVYVDLGKTESVKHFELYWESATNFASDFNLYVSDSVEEWGEPVKAVKGNDQGQTSITLDTPVEGRYVKLEITAETSGWGASCMEFEVWNDVPPAPEKQPADFLDDIVVEPVTADSAKLEYTLPEDTPEGYTIKYNGTDYEQVIDLDGTIFHPISDVTVKASFKITNDADNTDYAFKEFEVTVPGTMEPAGQNAAPRVLPELREWVGGTGSFAAASAERVVYGNDSLKAMAEEFAADYSAMTGVQVTAVQGASANAGDIFFTLTDDTSKGLKDEGYLLDAKSDRVIVTAEEVAGANWGGKTILQGMRTGSNNFPVGMTRDYPLYRVRGLILDVGRKTFTLDWLKAMTKQMAYFKMNDFQIHLNDNLIGLGNVPDPMKAYSGFRLESSIKKGGNNGLNQADLTSTDVWYSKADFKEYIEHSKDLGVNIIPEIDTPAHSLALTKVRPDLRYGTNGTQNDHLDLRGKKFDQSIDFVQSIFDEYVLGGDSATFADAEVIHIGADEYNVGTNAESSPLYRKFVNEMFDYAYENGHTPRVWGSLSQYTQGDPIHVGGTDGKPRAQINLWNWGYANMDKMYEIGFDLIDCNDGDFYIVPNAGYYYDYLNNSNCYNNALNSISSVTIPAGDPQVAGGAFAVWNDMTDYLENGVSEYDVYDRITSSMGLFAANSWGKGAMTFKDAEVLAQQLGDAPTANFGYEAEADDNGTYAQWNMDSLEDSSEMGRDLEEGKNAALAEVDGKKALELKGGESFVSVKDDALTTIGLGNDLRVKVKRTTDAAVDQVLFESEYGAIKAVQGDTGKVGITRENHDYSFNYTLPVDEWVELEFKNEFKQVSLYVNGELVDVLGDDDTAAENKKLLATCMFPLNRIGSAENAFTGYVDDVRVSTAADFSSTMDLDYVVLTAEKVLAEQDVPGLRELLDQAYALFLNGNPAQADIDSLVAQIKALLTDEDGKPSYEVADYCRIDAYAQLQLDGDAAALLNDLFTEASVSGVQAAWAQVREDLPVGMQSTVDAYEAAIVAALDQLELKTGDDLTLVNPASLKATASSEQGGAEAAAKVLDGQLGTMWHSKYTEAVLPISITLSSETPMSVEGFVYTPRQSGTNGNMQAYDVEVSQDGATFTKVASGTVKLDGVNPVTIPFDRQDNVKAVKIVWTKSAGNFASAAELRLVNAAAEPDFAGLQALVDAAGAIKKDGQCKHDAFTDATWDALQVKIAEAKQVVTDQSGDVNSVYALMGEVAQSIVELRLDPKSDEPVDPENPVDPSEPTDPSSPTTPAKPSKPGAGLPQTGDNSMVIIGGIAVVAAVALVIGVVLHRRNMH